MIIVNVNIINFPMISKACLAFLHPATHKVDSVKVIIWLLLSVDWPKVITKIQRLLYCTHCTKSIQNCCKAHLIVDGSSGQVGDVLLQVRIESLEFSYVIVTRNLARADTAQSGEVIFVIGQRRILKQRFGLKNSFDLPNKYD